MATADAANNYFQNAFFDERRYSLSKVGRYKLNRKLGEELNKVAEMLGLELIDGDHPRAADHPELVRPNPEATVLTRTEVLATASYLLHLANAEPGYRLDDQDHFANRRIRSVGELIQNQVRIGLSRMERVVRERMTTQDVEAITPQTLINIRPVVAASKEFFGTSQLSPVHGSGQPALGSDPSPPPVGARPWRLVARASRVRGPRRALQPLRPDVPPSKRRKVRISGSSARWRRSPASTSSASSNRRTGSSAMLSPPARCAT